THLLSEVLDGHLHAREVADDASDRTDRHVETGERLEHSVEYAVVALVPAHGACRGRRPRAAEADDSRRVHLHVGQRPRAERYSIRARLAEPWLRYVVLEGARGDLVPGDHLQPSHAL